MTKMMLKESVKKVCVPLTALWMLGTAANNPVIASPPVWIETNEITAQEAQLGVARFHKAYGMQFAVSNSTGLSLSLLKGLANTTTSKKVITEDGCIGTSWIERLFTPSVNLIDKDGKAITMTDSQGTRVNVHQYNDPDTSRQTLFYKQRPATSQPPASGPLSNLMASNAEYFFSNWTPYWMEAPGGGGQSLINAWVNPGPLDQFKIVTLEGAGVIRPYDRVALQSKNGWQAGGRGNYVSSDGGRLIASAGTIGAKETFRVNYTTSYITALQVVPTVSGAVVYTEASDTTPKVQVGTDKDGNPIFDWARDWTLSPEKIDLVAGKTGLTGGVIVLARSWTELSQNPGYLWGHREQIQRALEDQGCGGVEWELVAGKGYDGQPLADEILEGINYCAGSGKPCYVMLAGHNRHDPKDKFGSGSYRRDVSMSIDVIRNSPITGKAYRDGKINIVLAAYTKADTDISVVNFNNDGNSLEEAMNWILNNG